MHTCHATGCPRPVQPEMLMCRRHWFMVPPRLRSRVWATYRDGQCDDWEPSSEYCQAAKSAVIAVAQKEGVEPDVTLYERFGQAAQDREVRQGEGDV